MREPTDGEQGANSLLESVKAHVNERLKSPFGGAFVIAWIVVNWEKLFVLVLSNKDAETRSKIFADSMSGADGLWLPLLYAGFGLISYYILSGVAVFFFEVYGVLRRYIEQRFDDYRWVPPNQYIEWKRDSIKSIKEFQEIAADKIDKIVGLEKEKDALDFEINSLRQKIKELEFSEEKLKSELMRVKQDLANISRSRDEIIGEAESKFEIKNKIFFDYLRDLSMRLRTGMTRLEALEVSEETKVGAGIIKDVVRVGRELSDAIDEHWAEKIF